MKVKEQLLTKLPAFLGQVESKILRSTHYTPEEYDLFRTYLGEVNIGLQTIIDHIDRDMRILEVGSGIGVLGQFLIENGFDIHGIEPAGTGFGLMDMFSRDVRGICGRGAPYTVAPKGCEDLNPEEDGPYDFIFSIHVMEHVPDIAAAMAGMTSVLKTDGKMVHLCPNYRFPYDPHYSIPILFWSPGLTKFIYRKKITAAPEIWESLNFVTAAGLKKIGRESDLQSQFKRGVMANFVRRLTTDPIFSKRHNSFAAKLARGLGATPLLSVLKHLPPTLLSPMIITLKRK